MTRKPDNRMAPTITRSPDAPSSSESSRLPTVEAQVVMLPTIVPALICGACGRGMQPRILRQRPGGERDCQCSSCGCYFVYIPAKIRMK